MSCTAVYCRGWYRICKRTFGKSTRRTEGTGCYHKTDGLPSGASVRIYPKDRSESGAELYPGRASTDYCDDLVLSVAGTVCNDLRCIDTGKTGGCCKENRNDGSYISGCYQRGGACVRTKAVILIKSGLHNRRWRRCDRRYFEYGRPRNRKAYHGISRNRAA